MAMILARPRDKALSSGAPYGAPETVKKVAERHFFEFYGFCLSHSLPGGKTRKVRKPKGLRPLINPGVFRQTEEPRMGLLALYDAVL